MKNDAEHGMTYDDVDIRRECIAGEFLIIPLGLN